MSSSSIRATVMKQMAQLMESLGDTTYKVHRGQLLWQSAVTDGMQPRSCFSCALSMPNEIAGVTMIASIELVHAARSTSGEVDFDLMGLLHTHLDLLVEKFEAALMPGTTDGLFTAVDEILRSEFVVAPASGGLAAQGVGLKVELSY